MAYDYLIAGAGLFGSVFAHEMTKAGRSCLVVEKRPRAGGNICTEKRDNIDIHVYGAHIFHTSDSEVWDYVNRLTPFAPFVNSPVANYKGEIYNLPFNMNTFSRMWGITRPEEARRIIDSQRGEIAGPVDNLEKQAISLVGKDIYEKLVKGYTEKQWGRPCDQLPPEIIRRLPVRLTYDNNYFNDPFQGIPSEGYTALIDKLLEGSEVKLNTPFEPDLRPLARKTLYTGPLDELYGHKYGKLQYRSLRFEEERLDTDNYQGVAVMNFTDAETPYTRIIEHRHFAKTDSPVTWISREYPSSEGEPCYPINDSANNALHARYKALAEEDPNLLLGGRLAQYAYFDMDKTVRAALDLARAELGRA